ncbi:hypothetical protein GCM10017688_29560 [Streptomyces ramulosus]
MDGERTGREHACEVEDQAAPVGNISPVRHPVIVPSLMGLSATLSRRPDRHPHLAPHELPILASSITLDRTAETFLPAYRGCCPVASPNYAAKTANASPASTLRLQP